jgi:SAM-dependent methyltransferase
VALRRPITLDGFEAKFGSDDDPWRCRDSRVEALKRHRALVGLPLVATALDVACGDGAGTQALAARALHVDATDGAAAALASARRLLGDDARIRFRRARAPWGLPHGRWHRILLSELAYYLPRHEIRRLADAIMVRLVPGGELIAVHHLFRFDDARTPPAHAAALLRAALARRLTRVSRLRYGRYEVVRWVRPRG